MKNNKLHQHNKNSLWHLFLSFFKIGLVTFGGGLAMLPLIEREVVENKKWAEKETLMDYFAVAQSLPGVMSINVSIFVGNKVSGLKGAIAATMGVALPAFVAIVIFFYTLMSYQDNKYVHAFFMGVQVCSVVLIGIAAINMLKASLKYKWAYIILAVSFAGIMVFKITPFILILFGGGVGFVVYLWENKAGKK